MCWNCKMSGTTLTLIQALEKCTPENAVAYVLDGYVGGDANLELNVETRMASPRAKALQRLPMMAWPSGAVPVHQHGLCFQYLAARGMSAEAMAAYGVHAGTWGRLTNYVLFPIVMDGGMVYWQGRAAWNPPAGLVGEQKRAWVKATRYRKTLNPYNPREGEPYQAHAGEVIYNYDRAHHEPAVVICEGPIDAMKCGPHAVALLGKGTPDKIARLRRMRAQRYTIYLDRGEEEWAKALGIAAALSSYAEVYLATPPEGYDPGALDMAANAAVVAAAVPYMSAGGLTSALIP